MKPRCKDDPKSPYQVGYKFDENIENVQFFNLKHDIYI
jgi:hypothetical protein